MRLELLDLLDGGRLSPGEVVVNLDRFINVFKETDVTTIVKYRIEQQRNPHLTFDAEKATIDAMLVDIFMDAAFPVNVIKKNNKTFVREITLNSRGVIYAFENPSDSTTTLVVYEEEEATPHILYEVDMPLITEGGGGEVGFLNRFNSDSSGVPAALPTEAEPTQA